MHVRYAHFVQKKKNVQLWLQWYKVTSTYRLENVYCILLPMCACDKQLGKIDINSKWANKDCYQIHWSIFVAFKYFSIESIIVVSSSLSSRISRLIDRSTKIRHLKNKADSKQIKNEWYLSFFQALTEFIGEQINGFSYNCRRFDCFALDGKFPPHSFIYFLLYMSLHWRMPPKNETEKKLSFSMQ